MTPHNFYCLQNVIKLPTKQLTTVRGLVTRWPDNHIRKKYEDFNKWTHEIFGAYSCHFQSSLTHEPYHIQNPAKTDQLPPSPSKNKEEQYYK